MKLKVWIQVIILLSLGVMEKLDYGNKLSKIKDNIIGIVYSELMAIKELKY